jgi:hypothetical protein
MKIRIVGGPHAGQVRVYNAETNEEIENLTAVDVHIKAGEPIMARLEIFDVELCIECETPES